MKGVGKAVRHGVRLPLRGSVLPRAFFPNERGTRSFPSGAASAEHQRRQRADSEEHGRSASRVAPLLIVARRNPTTLAGGVVTLGRVAALGRLRCPFHPSAPPPVYRLRAPAALGALLSHQWKHGSTIASPFSPLGSLP